MAKRGKIKKSTIFFWIAGILLIILLISTFAFLPQAVSVKVGYGGAYAEISGISEITATILFVLILISGGLGFYFRFKKK